MEKSFIKKGRLSNANMAIHGEVQDVGSRRDQKKIVEVREVVQQFQEGVKLFFLCVQEMRG